MASFFSRRTPTSSFTALDCSEAGCKELEDRAARAKVNIKVVQANLFEPPNDLEGTFDLVITFRVVEHFDNRKNVLIALKKHLKPGGKLYTVIPNMAGSIGAMTKWLNKEIYDIHNPHNLNDLVNGHTHAGLHVEKANYICSTEFGVLSACLTKNTSKTKFHVYLWATRLTKFIFFVESKLFSIPPTRLLSPYTFCIAKKKS